MAKMSHSRAVSIQESTAPIATLRSAISRLMRPLLIVALVTTGFGAWAGAVLTTLHSFQTFPNGATPNVPLVRGSDGYFYGTSSSGGASNAGTVFRISTNGALTTLYSFTVANGSYMPLIVGTDGFLYGTMYGDGGGSEPTLDSNNGSVFRISTGRVFSNLYSFTSGSNRAFPGALTQGDDGYFYGTTRDRGNNDSGTVFKVSTSGVLTTLYVFPFVSNSLGGFPGSAWPSSPVQASDGNFYGTTQTGGDYSYNGIGLGTVFKVTPAGDLTTLLSFSGGSQGNDPIGPLTQGGDGYLYGTTSLGGSGNWGTVFKISTNGVLTTLYRFSGGSDGGFPENSLVLGSDGYFYGTTYYGASIFRISANGAFMTLYRFTGGNDGVHPNGVTQGNDGFFYGTAQGGGAYGLGTVFELSANGAFTTLYSFGAPSDGANPYSPLVEGNDGYFYGATYTGGTNGGYGTVFKISPGGTLTSLHSFAGKDGGYPNGGPYGAQWLVQGNDGYLYGTTISGGALNAGTIFRIGANGEFASVYSFTGGNDGGHPVAGLAPGNDGWFYGAAFNGGATNLVTAGYGTLFKVSTNAAFDVIYTFTNG